MEIIEKSRYDIDSWTAYLWGRIEMGSPEECWPFLGPTQSGYGRISRYTYFEVDGQLQRSPAGVHRAAWFSLRGPIGPELVIDHVCHNRDLSCLGGVTCQHRRCCNPGHMEPVANTVNIQRGRTGDWQRRKTHCPAGHEYAVHGRNRTSRYSVGRICTICEKSWPSRIRQAG